MASTFHGLETARRSLFTTQSALSTTGHNIANVNTAGYTRQVVNMTASRPIEAVGFTKSTAAGQLGTGVEASSIDRIRNRFIDDQFRSEYKWLGNHTVQLDTLSKLEGIVNEPSNTGLQTVLSNFWNAWSELSKNPDSVDGRAVVAEQTAAMADSFNYTAKQLDELKSDLTENAQINLSNLNSIIDTVAQLNGEIQRIEAMGDRANDLRDQRDLLTDELSGLVNIQVTEMSDGYSITMGDVSLVSGKEATPLELDEVMAAIQSGDLNNGAIYGTIYARDNHVENYIKDLNKMANTIANGEITVTIPKGAVLPEGTQLDGVTYTDANRELTEDLTVTVKGLNGLHQLGYTLSGEKGKPLFTDGAGNTDPITALNFTLNPEIAEDSSQIATSMRITFNDDNTESVVGGNNMMAVLMSQMRDTKFDFDPTAAGKDMSSIDTYFRSVVGKLGVQTAEGTRLVTNQKILVNQVDSNRQSVSGVSLDEEMSNLIKYQHAYNAAARNMTMIDEVLDRVINSMGRVGL